jgi:hypothetical protein
MYLMALFFFPSSAVMIENVISGWRCELGFGLMSCFLRDVRLQSSLVVLLVFALVAAMILKNERI